MPVHIIITLEDGLIIPDDDINEIPDLVLGAFLRAYNASDERDAIPSRVYGNLAAGVSNVTVVTDDDRKPSLKFNGGDPRIHVSQALLTKMEARVLITQLFKLVEDVDDAHVSELLSKFTDLINDGATASQLAAFLHQHAAHPKHGELVSLATTICELRDELRWKGP